MSNLSSQDAVNILLDGTGAFFFLRGNGPGKGQWVREVEENVDDKSGGALKVEIFGSYILGLGDPRLIGDKINYAAVSKADGLILPSPGISFAEERRARAIAMLFNLQFVVVDNFMTAEDRILRPVIDPVGIQHPDWPSAVIIDLDGTLADSSHRSPFNADRESILQDGVNSHVAKIMWQKWVCGDTIFFITGRGSTQVEIDATITWLEGRVGIFTDSESSRSHLLTRKPGDYRDDAVVKLELFNQHIRGKYNVTLVLDDRPKVVRMWQELGLPVLSNVDYSKGEF